MSAQRMIVDQMLPDYDVTISRHLVVDADPTTTLRAAMELDFLTVRTPLLLAAMWVRGLPDRLRHRTPPPPARLVVGEGVGLPGWLLLGTRDGIEVAFGAVGRFWELSIKWRDVPLADFADFHEPGWGKIACDFTVRPVGDGRTLLTYRCRTATTDPLSRRRFARYWLLIRPFVGHIMRATLTTIAADAVGTRTPERSAAVAGR